MIAPPLAVSDGDRTELERLSRSVSEPVRVVRQARALLSAAAGAANEETARRVGVSPNTVRAWRRGFAAGGLGWLGTVAPGRGPRRSLSWHLHFTPTSASWADLVECWFSILARKAFKNRAFSSVADLQHAIDTWTQHWNHAPQPLRWTKQAQPVIDKVKRARTAPHRATKPATHH